MEIRIQTPMIVDKAVMFFKTSGAVISKGFHVAVTFMKVHAPLIALIAGTAFAIAGFVTAWILRRRQGIKEVEATYIPPEETKKQKAIRITKLVLPIALFVIGTSLQITSFIISAGRISALSKALASALNAGSVLGTAKLAAETSEEEKKAIDVARNTFSIDISQTRAYTDKDPYYSLVQLKNQLTHFKNMISIHGTVTWNDLKRQLGFECTPEGYVIGWKSADDFNYVIVDPQGEEVDEHHMTLAAITGDLQGYRAYFLGMCSLTQDLYKVEGEA